MRRAIYPGSFDPVTLGHLNILTRALTLFDEVVIAVGRHHEKTAMFPLEQRLAWLEEVAAGHAGVRVAAYEGLTRDFAVARGAEFILRGIRSGGDFEYERTIAQTHRKLIPSVETVVLLTDPEFAHIHSTVVRDLLRNGGDVSGFVPEAVLRQA
jgi:pantetheine-phosphate adenylyltransferase